MQITDSSIHRFLIALLFLLLFVLYIDNMSLHKEIKRYEQVYEQTQEQIQDLEHEIVVYKSLCNSIIYGRQGEW